MNNNVQNTSFTSRCPQIRDGQWVCHTIATQLPHITPSRVVADIDTFIPKNCEFRKRITSSISNVRKIYRSRLQPESDRALKNLMQLRDTKLGNCSELSEASEVILKLNGIKNAYHTGIKCGLFPADHSVCVFNRDGSVFDGVIKNNNTIIVDAWDGVVDFAHNMFKRYENMFDKLIYFPKGEKFGFTNLEEFKLSEAELSEIAKEFPQLIKK